MDDQMPESLDEELWGIMEDLAAESAEWAQRLARLGLLREDQVEDAAALRAAALGMEKVKQSRLWGQLPRHRRRAPEHALIALMRRKEA